ncbi:MAG: endonuclease/exonuclease/phosphatase family protein [Bacteroidales bacterium]|nr:endonuclease/exonuclease/phosphatase family protein [Bacteroidales bacterium]
MKLLILLVSLVDSLLVVSWNVENFLDPKEDSTGRYTAKRLQAKCSGIAKTIFLIADKEGRLPDAVALMEVGNRRVLEKLLTTTALRKLDYAIVHYDSPDRRGIDCALLYRKSRLTLLRSGPRHLHDSTDAILRTRDILLAEFDGIDILVNHHPSKVGADSERRRAIAMQRMWSLIDSLSAAGHPRILSVGDFNDNVWPASDAPGTSAQGSRTPGTSAQGGRSPGTIKYNGAWEKIDGHFARGSLTVTETVFDHPALTEPDRTFGGTKPRRTFSGPRYLAGLSDHYPILLLVSPSPYSSLRSE